MRHAQEELSQRYRLRQLFNEEYRKSPLFRVLLLVRIVVLLFIGYLLFADRFFLREEKELITKTEIRELDINGHTNSKANMNLTITTKKGNEYSVDFVSTQSSYFSAGDTIIVFRNVLGKRSYISALRPWKAHQVVRFTRFENFSMFTIVLTVFSFFLLDGFDLLSRVFMITTISVDLGTVIGYLFL